MKKVLSALLSAAIVLLSLVPSGCGESTPGGEEEVCAYQPTHLVNGMSETERACVREGKLTLLDKPWENAVQDEYQTGVFIEEASRDDFAKYYQKLLEAAEQYNDEAYSQNLREMIADISQQEDFRSISTATVCGKDVDLAFLPNWDEFVSAEEAAEKFRKGDIGKIYGTFMYGSGEDDYEGFCEDIGDYEDFKSFVSDFLSEQVEKGHITRLKAAEKLEVVTAFYDALIAGDYKLMPLGYLGKEHVRHMFTGKTGSSWEFDRAEVERIKDSVNEIHLFDDEMVMDFVCHVILPPDYDPEKTYPLMLLTDAVWRFGSCTALRRDMESGKSEKAILATLGFDYRYANADDNMRGQYYIVNADNMDNFITENLMPLLTEMYNIDCGASTFFGHSNGGFLAHYMLFHSDTHENQPFGRYIIGSPSLWSMSEINDVVTNDYGYWERNETLNKQVFITVGALEDPDYQDYYGECDSTITGAKKLHERITAHGGSSVFKAYENSHHYQYIPEMLGEILRQHRTIHG